MERWNGVGWRDEADKPLLWDREVEVKIASRVAIKEVDLEGRVILTNQRLIWEDGRQKLALPFSLIQNCEWKSGGLLKGSDRIILTLGLSQSEPYIPQLTSGTWSCDVCGKQVCVKFIKCQECGCLSKRSAPVYNQPSTVTLSIRSKDGEGLFSALQTRLTTQTSLASSSLGVAQLQTQMATQSLEQTQRVDEAMENLNSLMSQAGEMSRLAHQLVTKLTRQDAQLEAAEDKQLRLMLWQLGMESDYGVAQQSNLAMQTFLSKLPSSSILSLADLYCLYNRACKGTALCSPADLKASLVNLTGPWQLRRVEGVSMIVRTDEWDTKEIIIKKLSAINSPFSCLSFSQQLSLPYSIAKALLFGWEMQYGLIARDITANGNILYHYPNKLL